MSNYSLDDIGIPTTIVSFWLNILTVMQVELIHSGFTIILSILSGIYLFIKIKNERKKGRLLDQDLNEKD
jgi:hypothetical protein